MSVFVDDNRADFGRMKMCHMIADSTAELLAMVDKIGVARHWIQKAGDALEHFDVCLSKRRLAVANGAIEISRRDLSAKVRVKREQMPIVKCWRCGCRTVGGICQNHGCCFS